MAKLRTFYAVTTTSLYRVDLTGRLFSRRPSVTKLYCDGQSILQAGDDLAQSVKKSARLAVTKRGLHVVVRFGSESWDAAWERTTSSPAGITLKTSPIVGLFLGYDRALACYETGDRQVADSRWAFRTAEVVSAIGTGHPVFFVPPDADFPNAA
jgi:hypothetical protein